MTKQKKQTYGLLILGIFILATFSYQYAQYQLSVLSVPLMTALSLTPEQFTSIFTSAMIPAIVLSIIIGVLADKIGMKIIIIIGMLISAIGGIGHIYATNFGSMYTFMIMIGFGAAAVNVTSGKMFGQWIRPELVSVAMGAFLAASTVGQFIAQATTALFSQMTTAFWVSGILICLALILWIIFGKEKKENQTGQPVAQVSVGETLKVVFSSRNMWICALSLFFILGSQIAFNTWIPTALASRGMSTGQAGMVASLVSFGNLFGSLLIPMVTAKVGREKPFIIVFTLVCALGYGFGWHLSGPLLYICFFIFGMCAAALMPLFISMPLKFKEVGPQYAGTGIGLVSTVELLGGVVLPTYIILPLAKVGADINYSKYFIIIAICWLIAFVLGLLLPETGSKAKN